MPWPAAGLPDRSGRVTPVAQSFRHQRRACDGNADEAAPSCRCHTMRSITGAFAPPVLESPRT